MLVCLLLAYRKRFGLDTGWKNPPMQPAQMKCKFYGILIQIYHQCMQPQLPLLFHCYAFHEMKEDRDGK